MIIILFGVTVFLTLVSAFLLFRQYKLEKENQEIRQILESSARLYFEVINLCSVMQENNNANTKAIGGLYEAGKFQSEDLQEFKKQMYDFIHAVTQTMSKTSGNSLQLSNKKGKEKPN